MYQYPVPVLVNGHVVFIIYYNQCNPVGLLSVTLETTITFYHVALVWESLYRRNQTKVTDSAVFRRLKSHAFVST